jgi:hypothetical protein
LQAATPTYLSTQFWFGFPLLPCRLDRAIPVRSGSASPAVRASASPDNRSATFHIDHFVPVSVDDAGECKYDNLLYVCAACNEAKKAVLGLPDPCKVALSECLKISKSGRVEALNKHGEKLRQILLLDSKRNVDHRSRWIRILDALSKSDPSLHQELMGFPDDLPDLRRKRSSFNTRPTGVLNCYFVLRENDQLPGSY